MLDGPDRGPEHADRGHQSAELQRADRRLRRRSSAAAKAINTSSTAFPTAAWDSASIPTAAGWDQLGLPAGILPNAPPSSWNGPTGHHPRRRQQRLHGPRQPGSAAGAGRSQYESTAAIIVPIPSLHRSDLIAYSSASSGNAAILRQVMFRPNSARSPQLHGQQSELQSHLGWDHARSGQVGRRQRRRRGSGQRVGRSGDAGALHRRRPGLQAAVRHLVPGHGRPLEPQRARFLRKRKRPLSAADYQPAIAAGATIRN